jgi:polyhydroxyalkanoate synthesis regulator protein
LFEEQVRQNMSLFSQAMKMFAPFSYPSPEDIGAWAQGHLVNPAKPAASSTAPAPAADSLSDLKARIEEMQRQIERLASKS